MSNNSKIKINQARYLRKNLTKAEIKLWYAIRRKQLYGFRFRKQVPIGKYIADFVCHEVKVIIELDGGQHNEDQNIKYDMQRTIWLNSQGYVVQRFWNNDVLQNIESVLDMILALCRRNVTPHPFLPPQGGKEPANLPSS